MAIGDVIILGAGASKSEGAPLQKELFKSFFDYLATNHHWNREEFAEEVKTIKEFFVEFWGIDIENRTLRNEDFPTFEECLGVLDIAASKGQSLKGYEKQRLRRTRNALIFLIAKILDEKLRRRGKHHRALIERLRTQESLKQTAFVSLNYDILIDNALIVQYDDYHLDYCVEFMNYERAYDFVRPDPNKAINLLKVHGSLNWLYCPTCTQVDRKPKKATDSFYKPELCQKCATPMEPVIIPPSFFKEMSNPFIQQILVKADRVMRTAERVFICGYSFPDADLHVKYLLKRAELYNGRTPEIWIVNPNGSDEFKDRYRRFFKDTNRIHFTGMSFEQFCERGLNQPAQTPSGHMRTDE